MTALKINDLDVSTTMDLGRWILTRVEIPQYRDRSGRHYLAAVVKSVSHQAAEGRAGPEENRDVGRILGGLVSAVAQNRSEEEARGQRGDRICKSTEERIRYSRREVTDGGGTWSSRAKSAKGRATRTHSISRSPALRRRPPRRRTRTRRCQSSFLWKIKNRKENNRASSGWRPFM